MKNQIRIPNKKRDRTSKYFEREIKQATQELDKEADRQVDLMYHALGIALNRLYGWKQVRLERLVHLSQEIYTECANQENVSMLKLCYEETGIELTQAYSNVDWKNVIYLNSAIYQGKPLTTPQWLQMRKNQKYWIAAQIEACILLSLHRKEKFGDYRCGQVHVAIEDIKAEFDFDVTNLKEECYKLTGFKIFEDFELFNEKERLANG